MSAIIPRAKTGQEEGPGGRATCTIGPCQRSPPLNPTGSHQWVTFLDPGTTSKEEQVLGQASADLDLGSLLELGLGLKCFLQEPAIMQEEGGGSNLSQGPWQMIMNTGSSGGGAESTCLTDGRS